MPKGYYKCSCGAEYISGFSFKSCYCLECDKKINLLKLLEGEKEENAIKATWKLKKQA